MGLGLGFGFLAIALHWEGFVHDWVAPWGTIFMRLLKLIAVPLVLVSLIMGVVNLKDIRNLSRIGLKTILIYICTTVIAVSHACFFPSSAGCFDTDRAQIVYRIQSV